ncbi:MAG: MAPEG family protein [Wenzhouxiangella sp.]|jgi:uncharacterized membrane protein YecN with MAPEG domain|nr:MAPEG family protein [Wenzhouxiangella sp.]
MPYTITLFYTGLLGLMLIALSLRVVALRRRHKIGLGSGDRPELELAIRAQANFCEYAPLGVLLLLLLEASGAAHAIALHILGLALVVGRFLHGFVGLNRTAGVSTGRFVGTLMTWLMIAGSALYGLGIAVGRWLYQGGVSL